MICDKHKMDWMEKIYPRGCPVCLAEKTQEENKDYIRKIKGGRRR